MCYTSFLYITNTIILEIVDEDEYDIIANNEDEGQTVEDWRNSLPQM